MNKINLYLLKLTSKYIILNTIVVSILILFINIIEISRLIEDQDVSFQIFILLTVLKLPSIISETSTFIIIIAISFMYRTLVTNNELISIRNMGFSIIDIFKPVGLTIFFYGCILLFFLNPISANFEKKFNDITSTQNKDIYSIKFIDNGMWIKNILENDEINFIHISNIDFENMKAKNIRILNILDKNNKMIIAEKGTIIDKKFKLKNVKYLDLKEDKLKKINEYVLNINFDKKNIIDSVSNYKHIPFYKYHVHIKNLKKFNLHASEISIYYLSELIKPFFLVVVAFVVMGFSGKFKRNENFFRILFISVLIGFLVFLLKEMVINISGKLQINYILSYLFIFLIPLTIGLYQMIRIERD